MNIINQKHIRHLTLLIFLLIGISYSCKKEKIRLKVASYNINNLNPVKDVVYAPDSTIFICGGYKNTSGFIASLNNDFSEIKYKYQGDKCVRAMSFVNPEKAIAFGDSMLYLSSLNMGGQWTETPFPNYPWEQYMVPIHDCISFSEDDIIACGGEHFDKGIISRASAAGFGWLQKSMDNELRAIFAKDTDNIYLVGYGRVYKTSLSVNDITFCNAPDDYYTGIASNADEELFLCSYTGKICKINQNDDVEQYFSTNNLIGRNQLNNICFNKTFGIAVGTSGVIFYSLDSGVNWAKCEYQSGDNWYKVIPYKHGFLVFGNSGNILKIRKLN